MVTTKADRRKPKREGRPSPWLAVGGSLVAGVLLAKLLDRRSRADGRE